MALPVNRPHSEINISTHMADLATASSAYAVATHRGRLRRAFTIIANAITTANGTVTVKVRGTAVGTITIATSGSGAGDVDSVDLGYQGTANFVSEGDVIEFASDGVADTTCITRCVAVIDRVN